MTNTTPAIDYNFLHIPEIFKLLLDTYLTTTPTKIKTAREVVEALEKASTLQATPKAIRQVLDKAISSVVNNWSDLEAPALSEDLWSLKRWILVNLESYSVTASSMIEPEVKVTKVGKKITETWVKVPLLTRKITRDYTFDSYTITIDTVQQTSANNNYCNNRIYTTPPFIPSAQQMVKAYRALARVQKLKADISEYITHSTMLNHAESLLLVRGHYVAMELIWVSAIEGISVGAEEKVNCGDPAIMLGMSGGYNHLIELCPTRSQDTIERFIAEL